MTGWARVGAEAPCQICGKSDWCSTSEDGAFAICRRIGAAGGRAKFDRSGAEYWVYRVGEPRAGAAGNVFAKSVPAIPPADAPVLDAVYVALLRALTLSAADRAELRRRGLTDEVIKRGLYRTMPRTGRARLAADLGLRFGEATCRSVPGVIARAGERGPYLTVAGAAGLIIPVRNEHGLVVALKSRRPDGVGAKYTYVSSSERGGPGPGAPAHVPLAARKLDCELVRVTEGELKADVATSLGGVPTISVAGVGLWRQALPVLRALNARTCRLAFDADARTNLHVAAALKNVALQLMLEGFGLELETWDQAFKGIDDCLAAGAATRVHRGGDAYAEATRMFDRARIGA